MKLTTRITVGLAVCCFPAGLLQLCGADSRTPSTTKQHNSPITAHAAGNVQLTETYGNLPLYFESNQGQTDSRVKFLSRGRGYTLFLTPDEAVLVLREANQPALARPFGHPQQTKGSDAAFLSPETSQRRDNGVILRMKLVGANAHPHIAGQNELPGKANYFIGNDPERWRTNVPTYARVKYDAVYPGVDLVYYGNQRQLENDFIVAPGADPSSVTIGFSGIEKLFLDAEGNLLLASKDGEVRLQKPLVYQELDGARREIPGGYVLKNAHQIGFQVAAYDASRPLIIDPVLFYSTYLGGSGNDNGAGITVDSSGSAYVTGQTASTNFPTTIGTFQTGNAGSSNAFVTKLNPTGSALVYSTYLGGSGGDIGIAIAVDSLGSAYLTGQTASTNFPTTSGAFQAAFPPTCVCGGKAFVTKLNVAGNGLVYSTYLAGGNFDIGRGIVVDSLGSAYVTGFTFSTNFPTTPGAFQTAQAGGSNAFVTKLNPSGSALVYSTYLGDHDLGNGIAVDSLGFAYLAGQACSTTFPTTVGAFQTKNASVLRPGTTGCNAFVAKLNAAGNGLVYSTYLGGSGDDLAGGIALDLLGSAYVTGTTCSTDFPTTLGAFQTVNASGGCVDAFVTKVNPFGTGLLYSTYLGGNGQDQGQGIAVDANGNAYVAGFTSSTNFPTANPVQAASGGGGDAFVTKVNPTGTGLDYSTYLGGSGFDAGGPIAVDNLPNPNAYVAGQTGSTNFPTTAGAFQTTFGGGSFDAFVTKIANIVLPPGATTGKVTGGGTVNVSGGVANFGFIVQAMLATGQISGDLQYVNHASGANVHSVMFTTFTITGNTATFSGTCTNNGAPCTFNVTAQDNDQPPGADSFVISINGGTPEGGTLRDGDIQIH